MFEDDDNDDFEGYESNLDNETKGAAFGLTIVMEFLELYHPDLLPELIDYVYEYGEDDSHPVLTAAKLAIATDIEVADGCLPEKPVKLAKMLRSRLTD